MKHRAIIVGAGRIGCGYDWAATPYVYTHADAYKAIPNRIKLVGVVEPDLQRLTYAEDKYNVKGYIDLEEALREEYPDIISICTPPETRLKTYSTLTQYTHSFGLWVEKPLACKVFASLSWKRIPKVVVNYTRRFDGLHQSIRHIGPELRKAKLTVNAKKDIHTVCHFTDLARFWGIDPANLKYIPFKGPCSYTLTLPSGNRIHFPQGGISGDFMTNALHNLIDAIEEKSYSTDSPVGNAIESENWAEEILES